MVIRPIRRRRPGPLQILGAATTPERPATAAPAPSPPERGTHKQEPPPPPGEEEEDGGEGGRLDGMEAAPSPSAKRRRSAAPKVGEAAAADPPGVEEEDGEECTSLLRDEVEAAACSSAKRTSSETPEMGESDESPAAAADLLVTEEEGVDRISLLADAILGEIVSLLPTKDAARTQTLASRWRSLWRSAPLNLDCSALPADDEALAVVVSGILSAHPGPGRRFCIPAKYLTRRPDAVEAWLRSPGLDSLQELGFPYERMFAPPPQPPPPSTFRFSSTLRVAAISQCGIPDGVAETLQFPQLKKLALEEVTISEEALQCLIDGSPVLENLLLNRNHDLCCIRINSRTLIGIGVCSGELIVEDAPVLQRLIHIDLSNNLSISVTSAPKLETLGLSDGHFSSTLQFGTTVFKGLQAVSLSTVVHTVKILSIFVYTLSLDMVIDLMRCFPSLESLYIEIRVSGEKNLWRRKYQCFIRCHPIRLKKIVLANYRGIMSHVNFAMFFVLNARMLELMRFELEYGCSKGFKARQRRLLQLENRASRCARFEFASDTCLHNLSDNKHVCDLSIADPFICRC